MELANSSGWAVVAEGGGVSVRVARQPRAAADNSCPDGAQVLLWGFHEVTRSNPAVLYIS